MAFGAEALDVFDVGEDPGGGQHTAAFEIQQRRAGRFDQDGELAPQLRAAARELADAADERAPEDDLGGLLAPCELAREAVEVDRYSEAGQRRLPVGVE